MYSILLLSFFQFLSVPQWVSFTSDKENMMKRIMKIESSNHKIMDNELLGHLHSKEQFTIV